ncbi:MAG: hypothetical protein J0L86_04915 [Flavobacteriales bacterium]|nr:hypothetical protein [Flavobacteriales bacterium]
MRTIKPLLLLLFVIFLYSCEDIIEEDITDDIVQVVYPQNNQNIYSNVVNFQWNSLNGADDYRVQVFDENSSIVLDSLVNQNSLSFPLSQGEYQWRVRGENFAYVSSYSTNHTFTIFETDDLTNQQVVLSSPADGFYTNNPSLVLTWQNLNAADNYSFELVRVTNGDVVINQQSNLTATSLNLNSTILNQNAEYRWKIKGVNSTSETNYSARKFYLDTVLPNQPVNTLPANNSTQTINQTVSFSWSIPSDSGVIMSPISYTIEFSNSISFATIIQSSNVNVNTFQQTFTSAGDYYWRIIAKDLAGNTGVSSTPFKFTIN